MRMCLSRKDAKVIRHRTTRTLPLAYGLKIRPSRQLARAIRTASPANAQFFQEPKTLAKQDHDSSKLSNDGWVAPYFVPNKNGPSSLPPQNNVDAGKDGSKKIGWQSSDEFRQHRFVDRDNQ